MSLRKFEKILDRIKGHGYKTLTFSGMGEPLIDPSIDLKINASHVSGYRTILLTNGYLLTPQALAEFIHMGLDSVRISFYGMDRYTYHKMHRIDAFNRVMENVQNAIASDIEVIITLNVVPEVNDREVDIWKETFKDADLLEVWRPHNWSYGKKLRKVQGLKTLTCGRPFHGPLQVQVDGTIVMCCFDYDGILEIGDLKKQTLEEIFSSRPYTEISMRHEYGRHQGTICENCDQRNADKFDVMIYSSRDEVQERVHKTSTTYEEMD